FAAGELCRFWERWLVPDSACSCGAPLRDCPVWSQVGARVEREVDVARMDALYDRLRVNRRLWAVARGCAGRGRFAGEAAELAGGSRVLFEAIRDVAGCSFVVDSSKFPVFASVLGLVPALDVRIVELRRDPRAVSYSSRRRRREQGLAFGSGLAAARLLFLA